MGVHFSYVDPSSQLNPLLLLNLDGSYSLWRFPPWANP